MRAVHFPSFEHNNQLQFGRKVDYRTHKKHVRKEGKKW